MFVSFTDMAGEPLVAPRNQPRRIAIYSHDTFGLGHLRRCRAIAQALAGQGPDAEVLLVTGSDLADAFDYRGNIEIVKIPSVVKLPSGRYAASDPATGLKDTLARRRAMIGRAMSDFRPDLFIVDKEPAGLLGEIEETLAYLKVIGTTLALGLRDVLDSPRLLAAEWNSRGSMRTVERYYDDIWVYGPAGFHDPFNGLDVPASVRARMRYMGFLNRADMPSTGRRGDYTLVTTGGGGDGAELVEQVLDACLADPRLHADIRIVLGPCMPEVRRLALSEKATRLPFVQVTTFDTRIEDTMAGARSIVAMGGYNTYCEILSFDKPALIVPRVRPREEQLVRARRARELGVVDMLHPDDARDPLLLASALRDLADRPRPSQVTQDRGLHGLQQLVRRVADICWECQDSDVRNRASI
jgi:predicted glycosyltransferase